MIRFPAARPLFSTSLPAIALAVALAAAPTAVPAQEVERSQPVAVAITPSIPDPADTPWPGGTIILDVDATDIIRGIYRVTEEIPLAAGTDRLTLLYPQWLPGKHSPAGAIAELTGIEFFVDGQRIGWNRDPVEVYAFHLDLPAGATVVTARLVFTSPLESSEGRVVMTPEMMNLQFEQVSLYPAGHYVRQIPIQPRVTFPDGWVAATALDGQSTPGGRVSWAATDYGTLIDSPIFAGAHHRRWDLGHNIDLEAFADEARFLAATEEQIAAHRALVDEALILFGSRHFDHYDFLVALTEKLGGIGLEHHRSSENSFPAALFTEWESTEYRRGLLPHEFTHSWNGKFRRPAELWTPDYRQPMQDSLLWMYEGQTSYWNLLLAARSGLQSVDMVKGQIARAVANYSFMSGRAWRSVEDTTYDPIIAGRKDKPYYSFARGEDYYIEGSLTWLEADMIIRTATGGRRSLEDFAKNFFGIRDGDRGEVTYTFDDVVAALNDVHPYGWAEFLRARLYTPGQPAPTRGIALAGYRLAWKEQPNPYDGQRMAAGKFTDLFTSLGLVVSDAGEVSSVLWDGPAFTAGITGGTRIVAVNGEKFSADGLKRAITDARGGEDVALLIERGDRYMTVSVDWNEGLRFPWLERTGSGDGWLDRILAPRRR